MKRKIGVIKQQIKEQILTIQPITAPKPAHTPITAIGPTKHNPTSIRQYIILFYLFERERTSLLRISVNCNSACLLIIFKALAASIEDKYKEEEVTTTVVTEETVDEALDSGVTAAPIVDDIPSFGAGEEEKEGRGGASQKRTFFRG